MKRQAWIDARTAAGLTLKEVEFRLRMAHPDDKQYWTDSSKLSRFENGKSARLDPVVLRLLVQLYGASLADVDPGAYAAFINHRDLVTTLSAWTSFCAGQTLLFPSDPADELPPAAVEEAVSGVRRAA